MTYLFDTNIVLIYLRDNPAKIEINNLYGPFKQANTAVISIVTVAEISSLAIQNNWGLQKIIAVENFLKEFLIIDIKYNDLINTYAEIDAYSQGRLKTKPLNNSSRNMGKNDLWIAATASLTKSKLITTDKDFDHLDKEYLDLIFIER